MPIQRLATILVSGFLLCACGSGGNEEERPPPPVRDNSSSDMFKPMEKARGVEDINMQHKRDVDRAIEANEGTTAQ